MKKILALLAALCMILAMSACDSLPGRLSGSDDQAAEAPADDVAEAPAASESDDVVLPDEDGYATGFLGDTMRTSFFDFTVNSAYTCSEYEGYVPSEGNILLVADMTVYNYTTYSVPMYDTDFQAQWADTSDDAFALPVTYPRDGYPNTGIEATGNMLPEEYTIGIHDDASGDLVFEVPEGYNDFSISFQEYFVDDTYGDLFFVYFTPEAR